MTYFEWIKTLPLEVMAEFLGKVTEEGCTLCDADMCRKDYDCSLGWEAWLRKEKKELKRIDKGSED